MPSTNVLLDVQSDATPQALNDAFASFAFVALSSCLAADLAATVGNCDIEYDAYRLVRST
jgi:hypothetical protein